MIVVTTNDVPGYRVDAVFGEVMGLTVRARDAGANFVAGWRSLGGGEIPEFTQALYESRQEVMFRMVTEAEQKGANAIVAMRFDSSEIGQAWTEVCAYGTAVYVIPLAAGDEDATGQGAFFAEQARLQAAQSSPQQYRPEPPTGAAPPAF